MIDKGPIDPTIPVKLRETFDLDRTEPGPARLVVAAGPAAGSRHQVGAVVRIGRADDNDIVIEDEAVSRYHIELRSEPDGTFSMRDLDSRNGTLVNGRLVAACKVTFGDKIALGTDTILSLTRHDPLEERTFQGQRIQALGQLAAGVAHDFNNILGAILGNISHLVEGADAEDLAACHQDIEVAARRGVDLSSRLLAFAQGEPGSRQSVPVQQAVDEVVGLLAHTLNSHIRIEAQVDPRASVHADPSQLSQTLMNLCLNAADAMPQGGVIELTAELLHLESDDPRAIGAMGQSCVRLRIADPGVGMDAHTRMRAFEPFFTTKPRGVGTGLGLATVASFVHGHGGSVEITSKLGHGTAVEVLLPRVEPKLQVREPAPTTVPVDLEGAVILFVDDEPMIVRMISRLLERRGVVVHTAVDGVDALEQYDRLGQNVDLVILDIDMPNMNGIEAFEELRKRNPDQRVVLSSGYVDAGRDRALRRADVTGLLPKPYDSPALIRAVELALAEGR